MLVVVSFSNDRKSPRNKDTYPKANVQFSPIRSQPQLNREAG